MKETYSINEVCKAIGLGRTNVYKAIKDGELKAKKWGRRTLILKTDLEDFLLNFESFEITKGTR